MHNLRADCQIDFVFLRVLAMGPQPIEAGSSRASDGYRYMVAVRGAVSTLDLNPGRFRPWNGGL